MKQTKGLRNLITGAITDHEYHAYVREAKERNLSKSAMVRLALVTFLENHATTEYTHKKAS